MVSEQVSKKLVQKQSESVLKIFGTEKSLGIGLKKFGTEKSLGISIVQILGHTLFGKSVKMSPVYLSAVQLKNESFLLQNCSSMHCKSKWQMFIQSVLRHHGFNSGASNSFQETM